jgi:hypothetical protein
MGGDVIMAIQFDRKISIDGVAVIIAAVAAIFWFARLESKVETNAKAIEVHDNRLDRLTDVSVVLQQNMAVLNALQQDVREPHFVRPPKLTDDKH